MAENCALPCVVSAEPDSSVGLAGGLALAGALPELAGACGLGTAAVLVGDLVSPWRSLIPVDGHLPVALMPPARTAISSPPSRCATTSGSAGGASGSGPFRI